MYTQNVKKEDIWLRIPNCYTITHRLMVDKRSDSDDTSAFNDVLHPEKKLVGFQWSLMMFHSIRQDLTKTDYCNLVTKIKVDLFTETKLQDVMNIFQKGIYSILTKSVYKVTMKNI